MRRTLLVMMALGFVVALAGYDIVPGYTKGTAGPVRNTLPRAQVPYTPALSRGTVLFVEDPADSGFGPAVKPDPVWFNLLTDLIGTGNFGWFGSTYSLGEDGPPLDTLMNYELVIWNTYDDWFDATPALTVNDQTNLNDYILNGGKVWLIGQDLVWTGVPPTWLETHFHTAVISQDITWRDSIVNPLGLAEASPHTFVDTTDYQANGFFCDSIVPDGSAHSVISLADYDTIEVGLAYPNTLPLMTSFWTVDGRLATPRSEWKEMVHQMLVAFELTAVEERKDNAGTTRSGFLPGIANPVRHAVQLRYAVSTPGPVKLRAFDRAGRHIANLADGFQESGVHTVNWTTDGLESGVYFLRLDVTGASDYHKLVVVQ